jgi:hypothetical protein
MDYYGAAEVGTGQQQMDTQGAQRSGNLSSARTYGGRPRRWRRTARLTDPDRQRYLGKHPQANVRVPDRRTLVLMP